VPVAGVVLTAPDTPDASTGTNAGAIARLGGLERVATLPRLSDPAAAGADVAPIIGWLETQSD